MVEQCYLKRMNYYEHCKRCNGDDSHTCYENKTDVAEHISHFNRLFAERLETSVDDEQFEFANFGMGFRREDLGGAEIGY